MQVDARTTATAPTGLPVLHALRAARDSLTAAQTELLYAAPETDLAEAMALAAEVSQLGATLALAVTVEAEDRGLGAGSGQTRTDWVLAAAPSMTRRDGAALAALAHSLRRTHLAALRTAALAGEVTVAKAALIARFDDRARPLAEPESIDAIVTEMLAQAPSLHEADLARLTRHALTGFTPEATLERDDARRRAQRALYRTGTDAAGMVEYRLILDPEGAAILEAALDPLTKPQPDADTKARDPRSAATRRADALVELATRAATAPATSPSRPSATVIVTIDYDTLAGRVRGAGHTGTDQVLSPATIRRIACDADLIPTVLGTRRQILDHGRRTRLVTHAQRVHLWLRDQGCTYPGCDRPPQWCHAHHVTHWTHGGLTNLDNLALLCARHHNTVHTQGLTATIDPHAPPGQALTWTTPTGQVLSPRPPGHCSRPAEPATPWPLPETG